MLWGLRRPLCNLVREGVLEEWPGAMIHSTDSRVGHCGWEWVVQPTNWVEHRTVGKGGQALVTPTPGLGGGCNIIMGCSGRAGGGRRC